MIMTLNWLLLDIILVQKTGVKVDHESFFGRKSEMSEEEDFWCRGIHGGVRPLLDKNGGARLTRL